MVNGVDARDHEEEDAGADGESQNHDLPVPHQRLRGGERRLRVDADVPRGRRGRRQRRRGRHVGVVGLDLRRGLWRALVVVVVVVVMVVVVEVLGAVASPLLVVVRGVAGQPRPVDVEGRQGTAAGVAVRLAGSQDHLTRRTLTARSAELATQVPELASSATTQRRLRHRDHEGHLRRNRHREAGRKMRLWTITLGIGLQQSDDSRR